MDPLLTVREAARALSVSDSYVRRHANELGAVRLGRLLRFDRARLCTFSNPGPIFARAGAPPKPESERLMLRRYQRGSVSKNKKKNKWHGSYRVDHLGPDGETVRTQRHVLVGTVQDFPTKSSAREELRRMMGDPGRRPITRMTFEELVGRWRAAEVPAMKESTAQYYVNCLKLAAPLYLADVASITRHDVERLIQERARTHSRSRLRGLKTTLSVVLGYALANEWAERNAAKGIKVPRSENCGGKTISRCILDPGQVQRLVDALDEPHSSLVLLLSATGLRIGEAAGLRWSDLARGVLHVQRRMYSGKSDELKTKGSNRKLPLPQELEGRLLRLRTSDADSFIFRSRNRTPLNPGNWMRREVRPAAKRLGIKLTGWHDFRHFFSRQLRKTGVHPKLVSTLLGHSKVNLAMDVYDQADEQDLKDALQTLQDVTQGKEAA